MDKADGCTSSQNHGGLPPMSQRSRHAHGSAYIPRNRGGVAEMVGLKLRELGETRQVFCVTHLPQVASLADHHFRISKISDGKSTKTVVTHLGDDERVEELARMLGGVEITSRTREHAAEMLRSGSRDQQKDISA